MKIADVIQMPDDSPITVEMEVDIVGVGNVIERDNWRLLPVTVEDETGRVKVSWFDPAETDWKVLKPKSGPLKAYIVATHGQKGWFGAKTGTYNKQDGTSEPQLTVNGENFKVPGLSAPGSGPAPAAAQGQPQGSGKSYGEPLPETELAQFQVRFWNHLVGLVGIDAEDLPKEALAPMFAALNTVTMQVIKNRRLEFNLAAAPPSAPPTADPVYPPPVAPGPGPDDDDIPF